LETLRRYYGVLAADTMSRGHKPLSLADFSTIREAAKLLTRAFAAVLPTIGLSEHPGGFPLPPRPLMGLMQRVWSLNRSLLPPPPGFVAPGPLSEALAARVRVAHQVSEQLLEILGSQPTASYSPEPKGFSEKKPPLVAVYTWCAVLVLLKRADVRSLPLTQYNTNSNRTTGLGELMRAVN
jgi:hypothetical protein